jgi:hypothetical protein
VFFAHPENYLNSAYGEYNEEHDPGRFSIWLRDDKVGQYEGLARIAEEGLRNETSD